MFTCTCEALYMSLFSQPYHVCSPYITVSVLVKHILHCLTFIPLTLHEMSPVLLFKFYAYFYTYLYLFFIILYLFFIFKDRPT